MALGGQALGASGGRDSPARPCRCIALSTQQCLAVFQPLDGLQQLLTLQQPRPRIRGAFQVLNLAVLVHDHGRRALNDQVRPLEIETVIHLARGVGQDRKRRVERGAISGSVLGCIAQNDEYFSASGLELGVKPPQLGDVRAARPSQSGGHKEDHDALAPAIITQRNLAARAGWQLKVRREITNNYLARVIRVHCVPFKTTRRRMRPGRARQ